jgi:FkbM family methyltransferase
MLFNKLNIIRKIRNKLGFYGEYKTEKFKNMIVTYQPNTAIGQNLFCYGSFEESEITIARNFIKSDSIVLDIGANIGIHSLEFSRMANSGLVISFEPQLNVFNTLIKNILQNNITNIIPLNLAVSYKNHITDFYIMDDDAYSSLVDTKRKTLEGKIKVLAISIDGLIGSDQIIDFIKIDVEGLELNVLLSMKTLLNNHHPVVFCEIYKGILDQNDPEETIRFMRDLGYSVYRVIGGYLAKFNNDDLHSDKIYNYFFIYENSLTSSMITDAN